MAHLDHTALDRRGDCSSHCSYTQSGDARRSSLVCHARALVPMPSSRIREQEPQPEHRVRAIFARTFSMGFDEALLTAWMLGAFLNHIAFHEDNSERGPLQFEFTLDL